MHLTPFTSQLYSSNANNLWSFPENVGLLVFKDVCLSIKSIPWRQHLLSSLELEMDPFSLVQCNDCSQIHNSHVHCNYAHSRSLQFQQDWVAFMSQPYWVEVMVEVELGLRLRLILIWGWLEPGFDFRLRLRWGWGWVEVEIGIELKLIGDWVWVEVEI